MQNLWNDIEAGRCRDDLALRVYTSRLLGRDRALVLHGGGNTSVKSSGDAQAALLYVKGSGSDLAQVTSRDFSPVRLHAVQKLIDASDLDNDGLMAALAECVAQPNSPRPSIETLLHAVLPWKFVEHTHADSVLAITNTEHGGAIAADVFGELAPLVPFHASGIDLARACYDVYRRHATERTIGLILLHHGVFAFGSSARASYENMLHLVGLAETYLQAHGAWALTGDERPAKWLATDIAKLRHAVSGSAGFPMLLQLQDSAHWRAFARRPDLAEICEEGPATPQHAVFVKRVPLLGTNVARYADDYRSYVDRYRPGRTLRELALDPAPRVIIDPLLGVWTASVDANHAGMTAEIFRHDMEIMSRAAGHDRYRGLAPAEILHAEISYGGFEQRLRARSATTAPLLGEVCLLAGPETVLSDAVGIDLAERGAVIARVGVNVDVPRDAPSPALLWLAGEAAAGLDVLISRFGGLDVVVLNEGFEHWLTLALALLTFAPHGGRIVLIGRQSWCAKVAMTAQRHGDSSHVRMSSVALDDRPIESQPAELAARIVALCLPVAQQPAEQINGE
ncbi:MAG: class II aldolase/adducin family protein [Betaproteobacteria bacterium]